MTRPIEVQDEASTTLSEDERNGLIPSYITLREELNEAEQANILQAQEWAFARKRDVLETKFLNNLHKRMFGRVWRWAGAYRTTGKNIGVKPYRIPYELGQLLDDCRYWIENGTYEPDEIATRFHHQLVKIHLYPNGNGRHARLATDLLLASLGKPQFTWGSDSLIDQTQTRKDYIAALREADDHNIAPLRAFVRS
jgi:Fic-DOC domain mobile mystery protein B